MDKETPQPGNKNAPRNRFTIQTGREPYTERSQYLKVMSRQLTPDIWETIVMRAIHDAAFGRSQDRARAREWFAKYILPYKLEIELQKKEPRADYDYLTQLYGILTRHAKNSEDLEEALATAFGALSPEERAFLRSALTMAESPETTKFWKDVRDYEDRHDMRDPATGKSAETGLG